MPTSFTSWRPPAHPLYHPADVEGAAQEFWDEVDPAWGLGLSDPNHPTHRRPKPVELDHAPCEGDCGATICACTVRCEGTVEQACRHHGVLCEECAPGSCDECSDDYRHGAA